ncbi:guanylate kinase [Aurantivibrio infirmus]
MSTSQTKTPVRPGILYTVSAPSGAGKTSLVRELIKSTPDICVSISHTTRPSRPREEDGVNYHFVSKSVFDDMLQKTAFLEHALVFGNFYGTSKEWVDCALKSGKDVILEIDWQGAQQVRKQLPNTISIFILPPSQTSLRNRLTERGQDDQSIIDARMAEATEEMTHYVESDFIVINDDFETALNEFRSIILANRLSLNQQQITQQDLLKDLLS